ncbi:Crp/Fnr family transcriptional regulator [Paraburkholderia sediminicola]|uniref:Crp/Fnr family transcriptional regulator n=1 Tax=Paraburkholderia sediminicola TaxID=458836 RepID=UPI0038B6DDBC
MNRRHALGVHRKPTVDEIGRIAWLRAVEPHLLDKATSALQSFDIGPSGLICELGEPVRHWIGVINGLVKMSNTDRNGHTVTFAGLPPGGWFGEGTVLKRETYRYSVRALRQSVVAALPIEIFFDLLNNSIGFNRFVMDQLNERLSQFMGSHESDRLNGPDENVARCLSQLFNPRLFPGSGDGLRITQQELAYIVGLSRQRVNQALILLEQEKLISIEYGGLKVLDVNALARFERTCPGPRSLRSVNTSDS